MKKTKAEKFIDIFVKLAFLAVIILICSAACSAVKGKEEITEAPERTFQRNVYDGVEHYTVKSDDTLLGIALAVVPEGQSVSQWIEDVKRINNRENNVIYWKEDLKIFKFKAGD